MKVFLDDTRDCPSGYTLARTAEEAIDLLKSNKIDKISLDHDLGVDGNGNELPSGYDVVLWLEEKAVSGDLNPDIVIRCHSANPVGRKRIEQAIRFIQDCLVGSTR